MARCHGSEAGAPPLDGGHCSDVPTHRPVRGQTGLVVSFALTLTIACKVCALPLIVPPLCSKYSSKSLL